LDSKLEQQLRYLDFVDIFSALDDEELELLRHKYPREAEFMSRFAERFRQEGFQQGKREGVAMALLRLLHRNFGEVSETARKRVETADAETLLGWIDRVVTASSTEEVLH
jgi:hypothetical protein